jgi:hypothetical protein
MTAATQPEKLPSTAASEGDDSVSELVADSERLKAEIARGRWTRWAMIAALFLLVGVTVSRFINLGRQVGSEQNVARMTEIARQRWEQRAPEYRRDIQGVLERTAPVLTSAMTAQFHKDMPKLVQAANAERDALADGFAQGLEDRVRDRYRQMVLDQADVFREEFPEIEDERLHQLMLENMTVAVDRLVDRYYVTNIERTLEELLANWDEFPAADPPQEGDEPVQDQLLGELTELVTLRLSNSDQASLPQ